MPRARYVTLDDLVEEAAARSDPAGFLDRHAARTLVIDEIQRAPALMQSLKIAIDRDRRPGEFVLTGSANILMLPRVSESLAGRMEVLVLRPFAQIEIAGRALPSTTFINELLRLQSGTAFDFDLLHYRTQRGEEVDFVVERPGGALVGIEVTAAATVTASDFRGIDALRRDAGDAFVCGIVLYTGESTASFGNERYAVPINALWDEPVR